MSIFLAIPTYGSVAQELITAVTKATKKPMVYRPRGSSLLTDNFNELWCMMANGDYEYFAMIHSDISPEDYWLDKLIAILEEKKADVVSTVLSIKDASATTSTAFAEHESKNITRLSYEEIKKLPKTFDEEDVVKLRGKEGTLLVNTGLWVMKVGDWCKGFTGFYSQTALHFDEKKNKWVCKRISEDWLFSMDAKKLGAKIYATRAINATHIGRQGWNNQDGDS